MSEHCWELLEHMNHSEDDVQHHEDERGGRHEDQELVFRSVTARKTRQNNERQEGHDCFNKLEPPLFSSHDPQNIAAAATAFSFCGCGRGCFCVSHIALSHGAEGEGGASKLPGIPGRPGTRNVEWNAGRNADVSKQGRRRLLRPVSKPLDCKTDIFFCERSHTRGLEPISKWRVRLGNGDDSLMLIMS